jgi:site-specific DNA recombinase
MLPLKAFKEVKKYAGIYLRVSTLAQAVDGFGLEIQKEACVSMCEFKNLEIYKIYIDDGVSGTTKPLERKGLSELIHDADNKKFTVVVFYSLDRIARNTRISANIIDYFEENNIEFISCRENIDNSTSQGKFMLNVHSAINELELSTIKNRLTMGREMRKIKDGDMGGSLPYGYKRSDKGIIIDPDQAEIVRGIFYSYYTNNFTVNKIANILNKQETPTGRKGTKWYDTTVKSILNNKNKYEGGIRNNNENDICWPIILGHKY